MRLGFGRLAAGGGAGSPDQFAAFISYGRGVDTRVATLLQRELERFTKPWYRRRALRVFRDDTSLSANPGLWTSIQQSILASRFLILLASRSAAQSR
jgi:hypothetical protein